MQVPFSSNPRSNTTALPSLEKDQRLAAGPLTKTNARLNVATPGSAYGVGIGGAGNPFDSLVAAGKDVLGTLQRERAKDETRDRNTFNARFSANYAEWSRKRIELNLKRSGDGLKGMTRDDEQSFRDTFLSPQVLENIPEEYMEHYDILTLQQLNDHLAKVVIIEDQARDREELAAYKAASEGITNDLRSRPLIPHAIRDSYDDLVEIHTNEWKKLNEGAPLTKEASKEIEKRVSAKIGEALVGQVEDARAREDLVGAMRILEENDRILFGESYDEMRTALTSEMVSAFGLRMGEEYNTIADLEQDQRYIDATDRERYEARRIVGQNQSSFVRSGPFTAENNSELVSYVHDNFGNDFLAAEAYLRNTQDLNAWEANLIIRASKEIQTERFDSLDTTVDQTAESGRAAHTLMTGNIPNYKESALISDVERFSAIKLFEAESDTRNPFPGAANDQYAWAMAQPLARLKGMSVSAFRDRTAYLTGTDRQKTNLRYRAARWSDPKAFGTFEGTDLVKINVGAHDMAKAAGFDVGDDDYNNAVGSYRNELMLELEPVSGLPLDSATVADAARSVHARMPDLDTSTLLGGIESNKGWKNLRRNYDNDPTADEIRKAETFYPDHLLEGVNREQMEVTIAAMRVMSAEGVRPDILKDAIAELIDIRDELQRRWGAGYLDRIEGSIEPGFEGGNR